MTYKILTLLILLINIVTAGDSVDKKIAALIHNYQKQPYLKHAQWSLSAIYIDDGSPIIDYQSEQSLAPASGLKLFTSSEALDILGEDFTCDTKLFYDGIFKSGTLNGNIYIVGGGDPTLGSDQVDGSLSLDSLMDTWVVAIQSKGISKINGSIIADPLLFDEMTVPDNWNWIDIGNYYGAGVSALNINDNLYHLVFKPASGPGQPAEVLRTEPEIPDLQFINHILTGKSGSGDNGYIYCAPGQFSAVLRGTVPAGESEFKIKGSIPDPPLFSAQELHRSLIGHGIAITNSPSVLKSIQDYDPDKLIHTTKSPPLKDIVYIINKRSFNLYAETLPKLLAVNEGKTGTLENGLKIIQEWLETNNIFTEGFEMSDGCGLSRSNMITTRAMVELLRYMKSRPVFNALYQSMGVAGDPDDIGYFSNFGKGTAIAFNARIKSGLINNVRSHSGYVQDRSGRWIAFSFIANNYTGRLSNINNVHEKILIELASRK